MLQKKNNYSKNIKQSGTVINISLASGSFFLFTINIQSYAQTKNPVTTKLRVYVKKQYVVNIARKLDRTMHKQETI